MSYSSLRKPKEYYNVAVLFVLYFWRNSKRTRKYNFTRVFRNEIICKTKRSRDRREISIGPLGIPFQSGIVDQSQY